MGCTITETVIDCADVERVGAFWSAALGWEIQREDDYLWMSASGQPAEGLALVFTAVPEPKTVKNRVHFDVNPVGCEQGEEVERLIALGARHVDIGQGDVPWTVLADPEGNEFCVAG
jgi:predicted enzyme related to lactoylglutathione lyase